jgi:NodT family efflux transporter outer membrane factor (OMF) lipoprotein
MGSKTKNSRGSPKLIGWPAALAAAVAAIGLGGCVNYAGIRSDKAIDAPSAFEASRSLPAEGGRWPDMDWPARFGDPQLPRLIDEALKNNPSLDEAKARVEKAAAYASGAKSSLYPNAAASYSWTREHFTANTIYPPPFGDAWESENVALASASWDLDLWGKNRSRLRQALSQQKAADAEAQEVRLDLSASVASAYNHLALLLALREIQAREAKNREEIARIAGGRVAAGLDSDVERQTANGEVSTSHASVSDLDGQILAARYQLGALSGAGPDRGLQISPPSLRAEAGVALPDNLPADLLSRRPDIVAAHWQVDAATHGVAEAKAEFFPDINLSAAIGLDAFGWGRFLTAGSRQVQAGPAIHLPIFDAGALRAQLKGRYADFDDAVAVYNEALIGALSETASQLAQIRSDETQLTEARKALDAQTQAYRLALARYKAGLVEQLVVLNADNNRLAADLAVTNLEADRRGRQIALIKALGGGFEASREGLSSTAPPGAASSPAASASLSPAASPGLAAAR